MKISCTQENLNRGLQISSHIASKNINLPILNNVLLKVDSGSISLLATNLEIGVKCLIRGKIEQEGSIALPAKLFTDYVGSLPQEKVDLDLQDQVVEVKCGSFETKLRGVLATEFPLIPEVNDCLMYNVDVLKFRESVNQVIFAVSGNEIRPEIGGVFMKFNGQDKKITIAATDSYRLAEKNLDFIEGSEENRDVIVPAKTMQEILRILSVFKEGDSQEASSSLKICLTENQIMFSIDGVELVSRVVEGQYPDYKQIIPSSWKTKISFNKNELAKVIKTASLFSKQGIYDIDFKFKPADNGRGDLILNSANSQFGENTVNLGVELEGEENAIVLNYKYLLDGLNAIYSDDVILELISGDNPCTLRPKKEIADYLYIIMPIKR